MTVELIPKAGAEADIIKAAAIPEAGGVAAIRNSRIIRIGAFTVANGFTNGAINTGAGGSGAWDGSGHTPQWIYPGGASFNFLAEGQATINLPLRRYTKLTAPAKVA